MKILKPVLLIALAALAVVILAGIIKFNFVDVPFVGEPIVYTADTGDTIKIQMKADDSIQVSFMDVDGDHLKTFIAHPVANTSGTRYESDDSRFVFWSKGDEASLLSQDDKLIFEGLRAKNIVKSAPATGQESIYFSESSGTWRDHIGICYSCTPENGFSADGAVDSIVWRELQFTLRNDLGESPDAEEVRRFFQAQYAEDSGYYPVHIQQDGDMFVIQVAVPKELRDMDFFDSRGALLATYEVISRPTQ